jgi:integrase
MSARKGGITRREVPIHPSLPLREWYQQDGDGHIITYRGKPVGKVRKAWENAKKKAGISGKVPLYALRHSFVTALLHSGIDIHTIASISGHSVATMLQHYAHASTTAKQNAIAALHPLGSQNSKEGAKENI